MIFSANEDLFQHIVSSYTKEFIKSMNIDIEETSDLLISFADLTVWYYNHNCQYTLTDIRQVWDQVESNQLGTKSLKSFLTCLTEELFKSHKVLLRKLQISKQIKKYLESTKEFLNILNSKIISKDSDQDSLTSHTSISYQKAEQELDSIQVNLILNFVELSDLRSAFSEGFSGFYIEAQTKSSFFKTDPVDINGNQAVWMSEFNLKFSLEDRAVKVSLFEIINGISREIARSQLDIFQYILKEFEIKIVKGGEGLFFIGGKDKYAILDSLDVSSQDLTKIGFSVSILGISQEALSDWVNRRLVFFKNQLMKKIREIDEINIRLVQYTASFKTVCFDNSRIYTISEVEEGVCCFPPNTKNKKRSCLII